MGAGESGDLGDAVLSIGIRRDKSDPFRTIFLIEGNELRAIQLGERALGVYEDDDE